MEKTFTTLEILNITAWYKQSREKDEKPLSSIPLTLQWQLKKNINKIQNVADNFISFKEECENQIRNDFSTDDKSYLDKDEEGNEIRRIKEEYVNNFKSRNNELNDKINEILMEKNTFDISTINLDEFVENLGDDTKITIDDIDMLSFMSDGSV